MGGFRSGTCQIFMGIYTPARDINLEPMLHWSYALYQQALDMGVQSTHTRLLGEKSPNTPF